MSTAFPLHQIRENDYWTVQRPRTRTLTKAGEIPFPEFKVMFANLREVQEGSQYTFQVQRKFGNAYEPPAGADTHLGAKPHQSGWHQPH